MEKVKENALNDFIEMIKNAWTVNRMTEEEKTRLFELLNGKRVNLALKGTYYQRLEILQAIFKGYLQGLGYTDFQWRESKKQPF